AREIQEQLGGLRQQFEGFWAAFQTVGAHLANAQKRFEESERQAGRVQERFERITGVEDATEEGNSRLGPGGVAGEVGGEGGGRCPPQPCPFKLLKRCEIPRLSRCAFIAPVVTVCELRSAIGCLGCKAEQSIDLGETDAPALQG